MKSHRLRQRCVSFEALEPRQVMAAGVTASLTAGGILRINGSDGDDRIFIRQIDGNISVNRVSGSWAAGKVKSIVVDLKDGNDYVSLNSMANKGNQVLRENVTVHSSLGEERVRLADRRDVYFDGVDQTMSVAAAGTVTSPLPTMPDSDNYYGTYVNVSSFIESYWRNVPDVEGLITDLTNPLVSLSFGSYAEAEQRWFETRDRLERETQLLVGTYHSFRDAQAARDMAVTYPPRAVPLEGLRADQILVRLTPEDFDGEAYCDVYVVDYRQPEARAYLVNRVVQNVLATGAKLAYLDNVGHPLSGSKTSALDWTATTETLREIVDRLHSQGVRVMINLAFAMGWDNSRNTADLDQLLATGVDGASWEMGYREDARTNVQWTQTLTGLYRRFLDAGRTVVFVPRVDKNSPIVEERRLLAAFGMMFRQAGDRLFVSTPFWQSQPGWVNWPKELGAPLASAEVKLSSKGEVIMERPFQNGTLWLNAVTKEVRFSPRGDFDVDGDVDGADFIAWQGNVGATSGQTLSTGDADGDGDVDGADFTVWQGHFPFTRVAGDIEGDLDVDGSDFIVWQSNFGSVGGYSFSAGDADGDGDVDGADFVVWQTNFGKLSP